MEKKEVEPAVTSLSEGLGDLAVLPLEVIELMIFSRITEDPYLPWCLRVNKTWHKMFTGIIEREGSILPRFVGMFGSEGAQSGHFRSPDGIAFLPQTQHVVVSDNNNNRLQLFTLDGTWVKNWPPPSRTKDNVQNPLGLEVDPAGNLLVARGYKGVTVIRPHGEIGQAFRPTGMEYVTAIGLAGEGCTLFVLSNLGEVAVWDYFPEAYSLPFNPISDRPRLMPALRRVRSWGSAGNSDSQFDKPSGLAVDKTRRDRVYVADTQNHRIQVFNSQGEFLFKWGKRGVRNGEFHYPSDVAVDNQGHVFVADMRNHRVQMFDANGKFLHKWGKEGSSAKPGRFALPRRVCPATVDGKRYLFVSDDGNHRVHIYTY